MKILRVTLAIMTENHKELQIENSELRTLVDVLTQDKQHALKRIEMLESAREQEENNLREGVNGNTSGYLKRGAPMVVSSAPGKE